MYKPFQPVGSSKRTVATSLMAKSGLNLRDLPELLNANYALKNENYLLTAEGGLLKRKGLIKMYEVAGNNPVTMLKYWPAKGVFVFGYAQTVAAYNPTTDAVTNIKTNWATSAAFSGAAYENYFFVGNTGDKIHYVTEAVGVYTPTEIAAAPQSGVIVAIGARLYAGVGSSVYYSSVDSGSNPPFTNWTVSTDADKAGIVSFRNVGEVNSICSLGDIIVAFGDAGKFAFRITQQDSGGTIVKIDEIVIDRIDMGGARGAIVTPKGLFYVNESGLWKLVSLGQPNIPYSDQETLTSVLLGTQYFENVSFDNADIVYSLQYNTILVTCAKGASTNNHVIAYNTELKAFSTFRNWTISRFVAVEGVIYGASSVKTAIYQCFACNSDDGVDIGTSYKQELKCGDLWSRQMLYAAYIKGKLHPKSVPVVSFDIFNVEGVLERDKLSFNWPAGDNISVLDGWGSASWGASSWGGDSDSAETVDSFGGTKQFIRNFMRIQIKITESSKLPHVITWCSLQTKPKGDIRRRNLQLIS